MNGRRTATPTSTDERVLRAEAEWQVVVARRSVADERRSVARLRSAFTRLLTGEDIAKLDDLIQRQRRDSEALSARRRENVDAAMERGLARADAVLAK